MKITKKLEAEISKFLDTYWRTYFEGNLDKWSSFIPDDFRNIGTTNEELWSSKKDILDYTKSVIDQMVGQADIRNKKIELFSYEPYIMAHELGDLYVKNEDEWVFYAPFRLSTILTQTDNGWLVLHQHGSYPDSRAAVGEAFSLDALKIENQKLLEAVAQRTKELENRNKELAIEAALERVRAVAMGMEEAADLLEICRVLYKELEDLGFVELRNTMVNLNNDQKSLLDNYDYSGKSGGEVTVIPYDSHPATRNIVNKLKKSANAFGQFALTGKKLDEWRSYRKELGEKDDPQLMNTKKLSYYFYSVGTASIGVSTYKPISKEQLALLERFRNVFELAYRRYTDIKKAEQQAREARIEAALEKVRARTMAMQHSSELPEAANLLFLEVQALGFPAWSCGYNILNEDKKSVMCWMSSEGQILSGFLLPFTNTGEKSFPQWEKAIKDKVPFLVQELGGKDIEEHYDYMRTLPGLEPVLEELDAAGLALPTYQINHLSFFKGGFLLFITYEQVPEAHDLFKRFTKVFEQTFTRFLDLQKAEAQAREAQIEAALERVRARTMAMHKSEELSETTYLLFKEITTLGETSEQTSIGLFNNDEKTMDLYSTVHGSQWKEAVSVTLSEPTVMKKIHAGWRTKQKHLVIDLSGGNLKKYNVFRQKLSGEEYNIKRWVVHVAYFSHGALTFSSTEPYPEKTIRLIERFAQVFDGTYTRFLDLKKAEAQAREAQIETALERVRATSMAMHHSKELVEVVLQANTQILDLGIQIDYTQIFTDLTDNPQDGSTMWMAAANQQYLQKFRFPYVDDPISKEIWGLRKAGGSLLLCHSKRRKNSYLRKVLKETDLKQIPEERQKILLEAQGMAMCVVALDNSSLNFGRWSKKEFTKEEEKIFIRFSNVFEQAYTRFLDLQKAEEQAREAQIEAALERVRASSMAMHKTQDIADVVVVFFEQLKLLEVEFVQSWINVVHPEEGIIDVWFSPLQGVYDEPAFFKIPLALFENTTVKSWKAGETFSYVSFNSKREINALFKACDKATNSNYFGHLQKKLQLERLEFLDANYKYGAVSKSGVDKATPEEEAILHRFAKVFEQTYTRFLDLQNVEAQAREAEIELALERVRARAMAMQSSDELADLIITIFQELQKLDMELTRCLLWIFNAHDQSATAWMANSEDPDQADSYHVPYHNHPAYKSYLQGWKSRQEKWQYDLKGKAKERWDEELVYNYFNSLPNKVKKAMKEPERVILSGSFNKYGVIQTASLNHLSDENLDILMRFSQLFEQNYTRFLDLQKAEDQAREAQVETALERIRSASMAMHESDELKNVVRVIFDQLALLDINAEHAGIVVDYKPKNDWHFWIAETQDIPAKVSVPYLDIVWDRQFTKAKKNGEDFFTTELNFDQKNKFYAKLLPHITGLTRKAKNFYFKCPGLAISTSIQEDVALYIENFSGTPYTQEENEILKRFTKVFQQTYTRFLDLERAEVQTREAQIETALERVRSRTMAMHSSDELAETAAVLFQQLRELGLAHERTNIGIVDEEHDKIDFWVTTQKGELVDKPFPARIDESKTTATIYKGYKANKESIVIDLKGAELKQWITYITKKLSIPYKAPSRDDRRIQSVGYFSKGMLIATSTEPLATEELHVLERFAAVFDQTYTRFLDLKRAEGQARESQIELSLERIRAQATAMKVSSDLLDIVVTMRSEFVGLGFEAQFFWHMRWLPEKYEKAMTGGDGSRIGMVMTLPRHIHGDIELVDKWERGAESSLVFPMDVETAVTYVDKMISLGDFEQVDPNAPTLDDVRHIGGLTFVMARTTHGEIGYSLPGVVPNPPAEAIATLTRFAGAFDLAYRRFEDLKQAEAREKEAIKDASLDRVRGEIASMRTAKDLERITPLVWKELTALGVPFFRCGIFIIREEEEMVHAYLSTPKGKSLGALHIGFHEKELGLIEPSIANWRKQEVYSEEWDKQRFIDNMKRFMDRGLIEDTKQYQAGEKPPDKLVLHLVPFKQGMLYAGHSEQLIQEHLHLMRELALAFEVAYSRYEDFVELEKAKSEVETTLEDLKSAQSQLVHSEKMASLGELTAGIAHEIQNPLNFVNNFSELNKELIEELREELAKGDIEEVEAITQDIINNEEKISHHGKRAEGIVKGMLQHSRSSTGEKEPTDINVLADEYLRLSYHGLRAKDKSFNADFETNFDETLPKINVVPQDIGRVLLNLINNAFYAVKDTENPKVTVSTEVIPLPGGMPAGRAGAGLASPKLREGKGGLKGIQITVSDNGPGIPDEIKDKIFQPFFTTKATGEGTGLGLSLSYDIITKGHGGELKVETIEGKGTTFLIILTV